jgi:hypothetical protein
MNFRQQTDLEEAAAQGNRAYRALCTGTGTFWKIENGNQRQFMTYFTILSVLHTIQSKLLCWINTIKIRPIFSYVASVMA